MAASQEKEPIQLPSTQGWQSQLEAFAGDFLEQPSLTFWEKARYEARRVGAWLREKVRRLIGARDSHEVNRERRTFMKGAGFLLLMAMGLSRFTSFICSLSGEALSEEQKESLRKLFGSRWFEKIVKIGESFPVISSAPVIIAVGAIKSGSLQEAEASWRQELFSNQGEWAKEFGGDLVRFNTFLA